MSRSYAVKEIFDTLQGEGSRAGTRAVFVRLAGCNLWNGLETGRESGRGACARWCDTDFVKGDKMTADEIVAACQALWPGTHGNQWAVITGGEPMLQLDAALVEAFHGVGWRIAVETNGTQDPAVHDGDRAPKVLDLVDHVCVSPKLGSELVRLHAHELKIVVPGVVPRPSGLPLHAATSKGLDGRRMVERVTRIQLPNPEGFEPWSDAWLEQLVELGQWGQVFIQPQDGIEGAVQMAIALVKRHPAWRLSVQTHKLVGLP